jgi:hypothetical protein
MASRPQAAHRRLVQVRHHLVVLFLCRILILVHRRPVSLFLCRIFDRATLRKHPLHWVLGVQIHLVMQRQRQMLNVIWWIMVWLTHRSLKLLLMLAFRLMARDRLLRWVGS